METSSKMSNQYSVASNQLFDGLNADGWAIREVDDI